MLRDKLKIVIKEFHETPLPPLFERYLQLDDEVFETQVAKVITITGPRRAGKTFYMYQIMKNIIKRGVDIKDIIYINFEDDRILPLSAMELQLILDSYFELYPEKDSPYLFLDEIQNIDGWEKFVRRLSDNKYKVFVTGSNSKLLGREIATALRGRTITYDLFPFSFVEFLSAKGITIDNSLIYGKKRYKVRQLFEDYMFSGGYPEIVLLENPAIRGRILQDYYNAIFYRDLVERYRIKNTELLRQWMNMLMANISSLISYRKFENDFKSRGIRISGSTLIQFAGYLTDIYFGFMVEMHADSIRKRQVNPKKFYLIDQGLHNFLTLGYSENRGRILENMVFLELRRKNHDIFYYKTHGGSEIDFLAGKNHDRQFIQVCYQMSQVVTADREKKALLDGMKELNLETGLILTLDEKQEIKGQDNLLQIKPVWEWMVEKAL